MSFFKMMPVLACVVTFGLCSASAAGMPPKPKDKDATVLGTVYALAKRVVPGKSDHFIFQLEKSDSSKDFFEVSATGGKILIKGNNGVSLASGLNWYLKKYCNSQFSIIDKHIDLPEKLVLPATPSRVYTKFDYRYFFNVCTFSYTMAWWDWNDWQRQIDWMAMNGINFPLAITGQEAVWTDVYKELGLSQRQIDSFLVGPAYLPWSWMGNVDGIGGPLPQSWIEQHKVLEQKILKRERDFGMTPILQAFTGHVPESIRDIYPHAKLHKTGNWSAGFGGTWFLDPSDELFQRIGRLFIKKQQEMYGTDHYYSADCFNEVNPDSDDPGFLSNMAKSVYQSMAASDPRAVWVMQAWFLYYSIDNFWKEPQVKALLGAVPDDKMVILDLYGEVHPVWKKQSAFYGKPWIWNVLQNFGGRTSMSGKMKDMSGNLSNVLNSPAKGKFSGIGMAMEYFGNDPVVQEFVMSMVWEKDVPDATQWIDSYIRDRYGKENEFAAEAWKGMLGTVYNSNRQTGTFLCERPGFYNPKLSYRTSPIPDYDNRKLGEALGDLLKCSGEFRNLDTYQFDVVNLTRQWLSPLGYYWIRELQDAYQKRDLPRFIKLKADFVGLIKDFDELLSTRKEYLLGRWIESAKKWAATPAERRLYEWNARNIITLWGEKCTEGEYDDLNNYAYKQWAGLFRSYALVEWDRFFDEVERALKENRNWDRAPFLESSCQWEKSWSSGTTPFAAVPKGDPVSVSGRMYRKYLSVLEKYGK
ncbi:MAG TPA: alpha-N-acetylglucosaminidase [Puia sp.]|nr:alpha-N-acetylglucosaminidase [Puia sp.]